MSIIEASLAVMKGDKSVSKWGDYKKELILRYASRVLPQLNAGRDDDEQLFPPALLGGLSNGVLPKHSSTKTP